MLWANEISVKVLESNYYFIAAEVQLGPAAPKWLLFAIYGDCDDNDNEFIWNKLSGFVNSSGLPVCAVGDFNCITGAAEKTGGSTRLKSKNKKFRAFLQQTGLVDLGHSGPAYTWANNQGGRKLVLQRLDRGVATADWINTFPNSKIFHLPNYASDHLPILLRTEIRPRRKAKPFKVEQWWSIHSEFQELCGRATVQQGLSWEQTCENLKREVKGWDLAKKDPNWELILIEKEMKELILLQQTEGVRDRIATLQHQYQSFIAAQEAYWLQRSRLNWDIMGDRNTKFFHTTTMVRRRRNRIEAIQNEAGDWLVKEGEIRGEFVRHFRQIFQADPVRDIEGTNRVITEISAEIAIIP